LFSKKNLNQQQTIIKNNLYAADSGLNRNRIRINIGDFIFNNLTRLFAFLLFVLVIIMGYMMYRQSIPSIEKFGWDFITSTEWDPVQENYGALPFIFGTVYSSILAILIALPLSVGIAVFLSEFTPKWLESSLSMLVELLAAIPSIVYGLFGMFVLTPWLRQVIEPFLGDHLGFLFLFKGPPYGLGMLAAALILTVMILPIITAISRDVIKAIPNSQREAMYALGATKWETIKVVLAGGKSGILGASILGLGRAVGETMAVTMVIGNNPQISTSLFEPGYTMASVIANEFTEATSNLYLSSLIEIAFLLLVLTIILNSIARLIVWSVTRKYVSGVQL